MQRAMTCPHCGHNVGEVVNRAILEAVRGWRAEGTITEEQEQRMLSSRPDAAAAKSARRGLLSPSMVLLAVGGIFVLCAAVMVVASFWDKMGSLGRSAALIAPTLGLFAAAEWQRRSAREGGGPAVLLAFVGALLTPYAVSVVVSETPVMVDLFCDLVGRSNHEAGKFTLIAAASLAAHAAALARYRAPLLTLPATGSWIFLAVAVAQWLVGDSMRVEWLAAALMVAGSALIAAGAALSRRGYDAHAIAPDVVGSLAALFGATMLGEHLRGGWEALAGAAPLAAIAAGCAPGRQRFLLAGMLFLVINIFRIGMQYFGDQVGLPLTLLACGALTIGAGLMVQRMRARPSAG